MSDMQINQVLQQMRALSAMAQQSPMPQPEQVAGGDFSALFKQTLEQVNQSQQTANGLAHGFELGDPSIDLAQVMIAKEKASLAFEAVTQVRNKLMDAYREVMNMPV